MVYYLLVLLLSIFSLLEQFKPDKTDISILKYIAFILILFIGGLRFEVGADWFAYEKLFNSINSFEDVFSVREEKLFMFFLFGCKAIVKSYSFFVFALFGFTFYLKYKIFDKYSTDLYLSFIIYIYTLFLIYDLNGIRQGMAMTIVLTSIPAILNKRKYLFIILITAACMCHTSAIVFFPFYWLSKIKVSHKNMLWITFFCLIISVIIQNLILNSSIFQYLLLMDSFSHYSAYLDNDALSKETPILSVAVFQRILVFVIFIINYDKLKVNKEFKRLLINGYFLAIIIFVFLSFNSEYAARLSFYYKSLEIFIIPIIVSSQRKSSHKIILWGLFIVLSVSGLYRLLQLPDGGLIPYNFILF